MTTSRVTVDDIRRLALALPEVVEGTFARTSTAFKIRGRLGFARFGAPISGLCDEDADRTVMIRISQEDRNLLLAEAPERYFITDHYASGGCILVRIDALRRRDLGEIDDLLTDAWRRFAPRRLLAQFDRSVGVDV